TYTLPLHDALPISFLAPEIPLATECIDDEKRKREPNQPRIIHALVGKYHERTIEHDGCKAGTNVEAKQIRNEVLHRNRVILAASDFANTIGNHSSFGDDDEVIGKRIDETHTPQSFRIQHPRDVRNRDDGKEDLGNS